jgi:hypothetical protein
VDYDHVSEDTNLTLFGVLLFKGALSYMAGFGCVYLLACFQAFSVYVVFFFFLLKASF